MREEHKIYAEGIWMGFLLTLLMFCLIASCSGEWR